MKMTNFLTTLSICIFITHVHTKEVLRKENKLTNIEFENPAKIVGGSHTGTDNYPWFASYYLNGGSKWVRCGGMLITHEYVLTAAHCIQTGDIEKDPVFRIGELCRDNTDNCGQFQEDRRVMSITINSEFTRADEGHDFALIRLTKPSSIDPVDIDFMGISPHYSPGKHLYAIGFGNTSYQGWDSVRLMHVELDYVDNPTCAKVYPAYMRDDMMCASRLDKDACHNDSGGPLFDKDLNVAVGIISWGNECATPEYPGVYARIASNSDWIKSHICSNHESPLPLFCNIETEPWWAIIGSVPPESPSLSTMVVDNSARREGMHPTFLFIGIISFARALWI